MKKYEYTPEQKKLLERSRIPFAVYQLINKRVYTIVVSDGLCDLLGVDDPAVAYDILDNDMYRDAHPDDVARISEAALQFATSGGIYDVIYRTRKRHSGGYNIVHALGEHMLTDTGVKLAIVWYTIEGPYEDKYNPDSDLLVSSFSSGLREQSMSVKSSFDFLTGLPSMTHFFGLAEAGKDAILEAGDDPVLLFMDFSFMKSYNSRYGFSEGNRLLQHFAKLLIRYFSANNCSRFGQDHFAVFTIEKGLEDTLHSLFEDCKKLNDGRSLPLRVGVYFHSIEAVDASTACDRAKIACDTLRNTYESCYRFFDSKMLEDIKRRQYIISNIDKAIEKGWIKVYYQPIVRAVNGKVCDEEALARWIDPVVGFLSPADFIPILENARLIYKLDLCVLNQVLDKIRIQMDLGLPVVPHSINLSRSDFDTCDIVEEIRRRVDASGVGRDKITIEITESIIGRDFEFIKDRILRLKELGFAVWMDDFGSGYSSLDVLQKVRFNLIKFDMLFMRQLENNPSTKIILTEMMKMTTSLGVDTVCEGVETETQVAFLREIGCSKLQGYFFNKPIPREEVFKRYERGEQIGFEDPIQSAYYERIGSINLYDLSAVIKDDKSLHNSFTTLPMAILEVRGDEVRVSRFNQSYGEFITRFYDKNLLAGFPDYNPVYRSQNNYFIEQIYKCCETGNRTLIDETLPDGTVIHSMVRKVDTNPATGAVAVAVVVISIVDPEENS